MKSLLLFLQAEMTEPTPWGWFHILWLILSFCAIMTLCYGKEHTESEQRKVLFVYGFVALLFETTKQIIWTYTYDATLNIFTTDYQWYAAPFQLCSTPMYVALICSIIKSGKLRDALLSYMSFVTILGGFMAMILPDSCFTSDVLVNIHTMWLHCGSFVVSVYLIKTRASTINTTHLFRAICAFIMFVLTALFLNVIVYHSGTLNGETFNMFYISPYFISELPVFDTIQKSAPYPLFLATYITAISFGATLIYWIAKHATTILTQIGLRHYKFKHG